MPDTPRPEAETVAPLGAERPDSEGIWFAPDGSLWAVGDKLAWKLGFACGRAYLYDFDSIIDLPPGGWRKAVPADQPDSVAQADIDYIIRWLVQMDDAGIEHTLPKNIRELARRVYERKAVPEGERFDKEKWAVVPRETFEKLRALPGREKYEDGPAEYALEQLAALTAKLAEAEKERDAWKRQHDAVLSQARKDNLRAEDADRYEQWLLDIGRHCGCGHVDERLPRCIDEHVAALESQLAAAQGEVEKLVARLESQSYQSTCGDCMANEERAAKTFSDLSAARQGQERGE